MKRVFVAALLGVVALSTSVDAANLISGRVALGVNPQGHLNVSSGVAGLPANAGALGLAFDHTGLGTGRSGFQDATSPGCLCEGWGASHGAATSMHANVAAGIANMTTLAGSSDATQIVTNVRATSDPNLRVRHDYTVAVPGNLFEAKVSIFNDSAVDMTDVRYVRVMDWDIPPTEFSELVTIVGTGTTSLLETSHDDGFESGNPLAPTSALDPSTLDVDFVKNGPADHGAYFKFNFGTVKAGESADFSIFYGAGATADEVLTALSSVEIELFSLGQRSASASVADNTVTYAFGFKGVGGVVVIPPDLDAVPEPATIFVWSILGVIGFVCYRRRK